MTVAGIGGPLAVISAHKSREAGTCPASQTVPVVRALLRAAARRTAGVALQAGAVANHGEVATLGAALALITLHARFRTTVIGGDDGRRRLDRHGHLLAHRRNLGWRVHQRQRALGAGHGSCGGRHRL